MITKLKEFYVITKLKSFYVITNGTFSLIFNFQKLIRIIKILFFILFIIY